MSTDPKLYSVGWICALPTEHVAAQVFLDETYGSPDMISVHDNNDYTLGRVGRHNVVVAVLPDGEYGTASAAVVAQSMLHSFPNVRIGLMVGIGGGAPSQSNDIRLGDIVVSRSGEGYGGVFQYDFGKTVQEQGFRATQFLNQPPALLRTAVSGLRSQHEIHGHGIETAINQVLEKHPSLRSKYSRPIMDNLFHSDFVHIEENGNADCAKCRVDSSRLEERPDRADEKKTTIHYGLIASANMLMKNALVRNILAAEKGVLCFEMEAAGLMNLFPCMVIRGICDYSDSHKNKEWQGYAAMAAAAYARQLLLRIVPNKIEAEQKIRDIIDQIHDNTVQTTAIVADIKRTQIEEVAKQNKHADKELLDWITKFDYGKKQSDHFKNHHSGTGVWFLISDDYQNWVKSKGGTLYCPGIPGAGKTVITSIVIDDILKRVYQEPNVAVAWIYCNFQEVRDQDVADLLASLLKQLSQTLPEIPKNIRDLYDKHHQRNTRPGLRELSEGIMSVALKYSRQFVFIDALDECQTTNGCRDQFLDEINKFKENTGMNVFLTSRHNPTILKKINSMSNVVTVEILAVERDIRSYTESRIPEFPQFVQQNKELQTEVIFKVSNAVNGMFLLAKLYLDSLIYTTTEKKFCVILNSLKKGVEAYQDAYRGAMARIESQHHEFKELAFDAINWLVHAKRPLTVRELQHALAVELNTTELDEKNMPDVSTILSVCGGLVITDEECDVIRLMHYTTQEYFERTGKEWFPDGQSMIVRKMLTYLSFATFQTGSVDSRHELNQRLTSNPLYEYTSRNWGYHAVNAKIPQEEYLRFFTEKACIEASGQVLLTRPESMYDRGAQMGMMGSHLISFFGVQEAMKLWLGRDLPADSHTNDVAIVGSRTPLSFAAEGGHGDIVNMLLDAKAEVNSGDSYNCTPLFYAALGGHKEVVKILLAANAEADKHNNYNRTPLFNAVVGGHEEVVKILLSANAKVDTRDNYGQTPLSSSANCGWKGVVGVLLAANADVNSRDNFGETPLVYAIRRGHKEIVQILLAADANIEIANNTGGTALSHALQGDNEEIVDLILARARTDP